MTDFIEPIQITDYPLSIDNLLVNQQASRLAFSCQVYANLSIQETAARQATVKASGQLVYKFDKLFIRHWDEYMTGLRHHPFVVSIARDAKGTFQFVSTPTDVLFGVDSDSPTRPFGDGKSQWSFSASGNSFAFTRQHDETKLGENAYHVIYKLRNVQSPDAELFVVVGFVSSHDVNPHPENDEMFLYTSQTLTEPLNIWLQEFSTVDRPITEHNKNLLDRMHRSNAESFTFMGAKNEKVWGWHVPPTNGTTQKAPLAFLIHGGPQNSWYKTWSFGWNFQVFAAQGYAVIAINFHGSDSYGQNFTDSITGQYGTLPYEDLQLGLTAALEMYEYIDGNRAVALGASYGGFMINWIAGHPEMSQRFRTLVCHDGLFDMRAMAYSTEELWFSEHDAGGFTPYENPEAFEKFNPVNHVANWTKPMLIIHGGRDYRVPDTQGIGAFTALQRHGIPSRLLYLPNENHWTLNPLNSVVWYEEVLDWMRRWTK
ncbi:unnamed protein product [Rotaria sp. Silwood2]|nr:unnamed protein product [Rotaria sp. Silwood2]CAF3136966.1 unnamed protein product [Rotaria sp. Silwood2]CAF4225292.1 unnamed protein product [Rotaria sp. Silwood2]CAF4270035.1 unnamed protein product [Rotaria sp. Silwood2]